MQSFSQPNGLPTMQEGSAMSLLGRRSEVISAASLMRNPDAAGRRMQAWALSEPLRQLPLALQQKRRQVEYSAVRDNGDEAALLELVEEREQAYEELEERSRELQAMCDATWIELDDCQKSLDDASRLVLTLRRSLLVREQDDDTEEDDDPELLEVASCLEVLEFSQELLPNVIVTADPAKTAALDKHQLATAWARTAWWMLIALNDYVVAKRIRNFEGNVLKYATDPPPMARMLQAGRVALQESESTRLDPSARRSREFVVPPIIDSSRKIFMPAHLKVSQADRYPRIHFHDDTRGSSGKVVVGYFGEHLPTAG